MATVGTYLCTFLCFTSSLVSILYVLSTSSVSCLDRVPVCVFFILFPHLTLIHLPICLPALCRLKSLLLILPPCASVSISLSAPFPVCLLTFCLSVHSARVPAFLFIALFALCLTASSLRCFSFSVSVFLQLSEFLSLCKSLCPFLHFLNIISHVRA